MKGSNILRWLEKYFEEAVGVTFLILLSLAMMLQIIMRYIFSAPFTWSEEFCRYCFIYSVMFGIGYCTRHNKTLRVDLLVTLLPTGIGRLLDFLGKLLTLVLYGFLFYAAIQVTKNSYVKAQLSPAMMIPMWWVFLSAPLGFFFAILRTIQSMFHDLRRRLGTKEENT